jgi:hypothetical protein
MEAAFTYAKGIYQITVASQFDGFASWHNISVDRSTNASYAPPDGYIVIGRGTYTGPSGSGVTESYMPLEALSPQKNIAYSVSGDALESSGAKKYGGTLGPEEIDEIASKAFDIPAVWKILMDAVGGKIGVIGDFSGFTGFSRIFKVEPHTLMMLLAGGSATPAEIMSALYSGMGLMVVQRGIGDLALTSIAEAIYSPMAGVSVDSDQLISSKTSFDFTKIPKATVLNLDPSGRLTSESLVNASTDQRVIDRAAMAAESGENYAPTIETEVPGAKFGVSVGRAAYPTSQAPLVVSSINMADIDGGESGEISVPGLDKPVKPEIVKKKTSSFRTANGAPAEEEAVNVAAVPVVAKQVLYRSLQKAMGARVLMQSAQRSAIYDGIPAGAFEEISFSGGGSSLQKVVFCESGYSQETEMSDGVLGGVVTGMVATLAAGILTTQVTYVNTENPYG